MTKRRFGVSLPESLAKALDELSARLSVPRSTLIQEAVENLIEDYSHLTRPHHCVGLIVVTGIEGRLDAQRLLEEHREVVRSSSHHHAGGRCLELIVVEGPSERIVQLLSELRAFGCNARFIPLHSYGGGCEHPSLG